MNRKIITVIVVALALMLVFTRIGVRRLTPEPVHVPETAPQEERKDETRGVVDQSENNDLTELPDQEAEMITFDELNFEITVIAENLEVPWEIIPLPDEDDWLISQRYGVVTSLQHGSVLSIDEVAHTGEGGLLGMTLHPEFRTNRFIYFYYTTQRAGGLMNRIVRFQYENQTFTNETLILDNIPGHRVHNGGRLAFGPDGFLYATTGDAAVTSLSQDLDNLAGKILRMTEEGDVPDDNPYENSFIYSYGHRNPQGLAWHPNFGTLFSSEHGPTRMDEINIIHPGKNYGWPEATCDDAPTEFEDPVSCYRDFTLAPSGMDFIDMERLDGTHLLVSGLRGGQIRHLSLDEDGIPKKEQPLFTDYGRIRTVRYHEGAVYFVTNNQDGRGNPAPNDDRMFRVDLIATQ